MTGYRTGLPKVNASEGTPLFALLEETLMSAATQCRVRHSTTGALVASYAFASYQRDQALDVTFPELMAATLDEDAWFLAALGKTTETYTVALSLDPFKGTEQWFRMVVDWDQMSLVLSPMIISSHPA